MPDASGHSTGTHGLELLEGSLARVGLDADGGGAPVLGRNEVSKANERGTRGARAAQGDEDHCPWLRGRAVDPAWTAVQRLDNEIKAFAAWSRPSRGEHAFRLQVYACFERLVERLWPGAKVQLFGSSVTGLYLPHGDFDVVISHNPLSRIPTSNILRSLSNAVTSSGFGTGRPEMVTTAKVPILKFSTAPAYGSYRFDVSFNGSNGPAGAKESMRLLSEIEAKKKGGKERVKNLIMVVKALLDSLELNEVKHGGLGGLSVFCMCMGFIQHKDRLSIQHPVTPQRDLSSGSNKFPTIRKELQRCRDQVYTYLFSPSTPSGSLLTRLGIAFSTRVLDRRRDNIALYELKSLEEKAKSWVPNVQEDPAVKRMAPSRSPSSGSYAPSLTPPTPTSASTGFSPPQPAFSPLHAAPSPHPPPSASISYAPSSVPQAQPPIQIQQYYQQHQQQQQHYQQQLPRASSSSYPSHHRGAPPSHTDAYAQYLSSIREQPVLSQSSAFSYAPNLSSFPASSPLVQPGPPLPAPHYPPQPQPPLTTSAAHPYGATVNGYHGYTSSALYPAELYGGQPQQRGYCTNGKEREKALLGGTA
ncbi:hypothetical protein JCM8547_005079 [Rhodosporidiobolus lusitaniae]